MFSVALDPGVGCLTSSGPAVDGRPGSFVMTRILPSVLLLLCMVLGTAHAQFGDDTPDRPEELAPAPPGVEPVVPLDKDDPTYDLWRKRRDDLQAGRDPGPIAIQRYPGGFMPMGIDKKHYLSPLTVDDGR